MDMQEHAASMWRDGVVPLVGFVVGGVGWLWALYDESVTEQSMIWLLGALPAAVVGAWVIRWLYTMATGR